ncbi:caspase family protein [Paractinoplanes lichenicola]|uniref:Caspase family protein n=1 Tax=Paractinoplanes lichenicola TaxID=2802976 RepID=A0ABS1VVF8_9ACTN|nr:caspase family protein [Actinoplanes lichenicola]
MPGAIDRQHPDASLNPLNPPTKDVARLHRALVQPGTGLFAEKNVRLITERTSDEMLDELDVFFSDARKDDLLLLCYSGHGLLDERNNLYLCGRTTRSDVDLREIFDYVRDTLTATSKQIPHCRFDGDASVKLARCAAAPAPRQPERTSEPAFVLSEYAIVLRDVHLSERLAPEVVEIYPPHASWPGSQSGSARRQHFRPSSRPSRPRREVIATDGRGWLCEGRVRWGLRRPGVFGLPRGGCGRRWRRPGFRSPRGCRWRSRG